MRKRGMTMLLVMALLLGLGGCRTEVTPQTEDTTTPAEQVLAAADAIEKLAGEDYGLANALDELTEKSTATVGGDSYYRLQQNYKGIPVYGRTVICTTDEQGNVISLTGNPADVDPNLKLTPSVTAEQVRNGLRVYMAEVLGLDGELPRIDQLSPEDLCIYNLDESGWSRLAYCIRLGGYEFLVDAATGEVLQSIVTVYDVAVEGYKASDMERKSPIWVEKYSETEYGLEDEARNCEIKNLCGIESTTESGNRTVWNLDKASRVISEDNIFGNDPEKETDHEDGATLLQNFQNLYDFYAVKLKIRKHSHSGQFVIYYNDGYQNGRNARGGSYDGHGVLMMGSVTGVNDVDVMAHEYMHMISRANVGWTNASIENYALNEAYSDIYGEIAEAYLLQWAAPNWVMDLDNMNWVVRSIRKPDETGNADNAAGLSEEYGKSADEIVTKGYQYSTVISHAAYLMWNGIDRNEAKKLSTDQLAELWYRAMLMMPSDCDFYGCRRLVELAATSMRLTQDQIDCVSEAFNRVGITWQTGTPAVARYDVTLDSTLSVYGADGELYDNYTLDIVGNTNIYGPVLDKNDLSYSGTRTITEAKEHALNLPEGFYTFTISDNDNPNRSETITVSVRAEGKGKNISISTDFGSIPVKGTVSEIRRENGVETNIPITDAVVRIQVSGEDTVVQTIHMSETEGFFETDLPAGHYSFFVNAEGYIPMTYTFELTADSPAYLELVLEADVEYVTDAYTKECTYRTKLYNYETGTSEEKEITCVYRIPQINFHSADVDRLNEKIYDDLYPVITESAEEIAEYQRAYPSSGISYQWAVNGEILSLAIVINSDAEYGSGDAYMVYNIDIGNGKQVANDAVIATVGWSEAEYYERARQVLGSAYWNGWTPENEEFENKYFIQFFNEQLRRTISDDNIAQCKPYINEKGQLCIIAKKYSLAAADYYWVNLNMVDFVLSPYYDAEAEQIEHGIRISEEEAYRIACEYWHYTEGDVSSENGFEMYVVPEPGSSLREEVATGRYYYVFMLRWLVVDENGDSWMSTCDIVHIDAETGECGYFE